jgi:hypothetical protein
MEQIKKKMTFLSAIQAKKIKFTLFWSAILDLWLLLELPKVVDSTTKLNLFKDPMGVQINQKSL